MGWKAGRVLQKNPKGLGVCTERDEGGGAGRDECSLQKKGRSQAEKWDREHKLEEQKK